MMSRFPTHLALRRTLRLAALAATLLLGACTHNIGAKSQRDVYVLRGTAIGADGKPEDAWEIRGQTTRSLVTTPTKGRRLSHLRMQPLAWSDKALPVREMETLFARGHDVGKLDVLGASAVQSAGRRALRVTGTVTFGKDKLHWRRIITEADVPGVVSIRTELEVSPQTSDVDLLERTYWKSDPFVPHQGPVDTEGPFPTSWIGAESKSDGFVLSSSGFYPHVTATYEIHGPHHFLNYTDLRSRGQRVGERLLWWTRSVLIPDTLAEALRRAGWSEGNPYSEARVSLTHEPPSAALRANYADGTPWLWTRTPPGKATVLPLPRNVTRVDLMATAFGHSASAPFHLDTTVQRAATLDVPLSGQIHIQITDAATGAPIPARVRIVPVDPPTKFSLGPDYRAAGAMDTAYTLSGDLTLTAPIGRHRLLISHGLDWSWSDQPVVVAGSAAAEVSVTLKHRLEHGGWIACDFHLHANPSPDSEITLEDKVTALSVEGIEFAVPTDHDHVTDYRPAIDAVHADMDTVPGAEVTTADPIFGHINAFPLTLDPSVPNGGAPNPVGRAPAELFEELHHNTPHTLVQVNHPRLEGGIGYFDVMGMHDAGEATDPRWSTEFDLLEVWNGFDLARQEKTDANFAEWLALLAHGHRFVATGNSDSHTLRTQWSGYPRTYVNVGEHALEENDDPVRPPLMPSHEEEHRVIRALRTGRAMVTNGPFLMATVGGDGPGAHIEVNNSRVELLVDVQMPPWAHVNTLEVFRGQEKFATITLKPSEAAKSRITRRIRVAVPESTFLVVTARGTEPMTDYFGKQNIFPFAFTNPIWIERK